MKIAILSNVNVDMLISKVSKSANVYVSEGYGAWLQELLEQDSNLYNFSPAYTFVLLDAQELFGNSKTIEESTLEILRFKEIFQQIIERHPNINFYISDLDYLEYRIRLYTIISDEKQIEILWIKMLFELQKTYPNMFVFRLKELISEFGRTKFYSPKLWYLGGFKYSGAGETLIAKKMEHIFAATSIRKKCLLLDLDNTLWGGVVGELGASKIAIAPVKEGAQFRDFQLRMKEIKDTGILLGIVSKNNWDDAREVFESNEYMVLRQEDFAIIKVNWKDKVDNIREISQELNIGLDSLVFIDDNPVEREAIKELLPEVAVPDFPQDTTELGRFAQNIWQDYFFTVSIVQEDLNKTNMYRQNSERVQALKKAVNMEEYLKSLNTIIKVWLAKPNDAERIAQLTQKTNQFNLTTKRYTEDEVIELINSKSHYVFVASVEDKYGDNGKVVVMIIKKGETSAELDAFLMSCRVMGRKIEDQLLEYIEQKMYQEGFTTIISHYYLTAKNKPVEDLFDRLGYEIKYENNGNKEYIFQLPGCLERSRYARLEEA
ncbi:HAD-IIIC family phosphatase [Sporomusa aerivorans]|uniref:HAD-IIIC family phosphatase n=1 Tax=Sporomusa aerivorans TaxID=204936 RepID=UPI00352B50FF